MRDLLPFIVVGLSSGSVYAIAAMGLVVTYKTSGVVNFAHGALGMVATFVFYSLRVDVELPTALALVISVGLVAPVLGLIVHRAVLRRLAGATATTFVVASLGLLVALQGLVSYLYGAQTRQLESFLPTSTFRLPGVNVGWDQLIIVVIAAASALLLGLFFRTTRLGLQTRAVVDDEELAELTATDSRLVASFSWMLGSAFAGLSGVLLAPIVGLDVTVLTLLVLQTFGAVVIGRLTSLPATYLGALGIGVAASLATKVAAEHPGLSGLPTSLPFVVLFLVLVLSPKDRFREVVEARLRTTAAAPSSQRMSPPALAILLGVAVLLPAVFEGADLFTATATVVFVLVFASLSLLVGLSRQVSLCHAVFVGLGASSMAHLTDAGIPFSFALLLTGLIMAPVGALVAIPAIRLSGLFLALATFGFGVLAQSLLYGTSWAFGDDATLVLDRPSFLGIDFSGDVAFYYLVLAAVLVGLVLLEGVARTRLGRILRALADSPTAVESLGVSATLTRVLAFCLSASLAAVSGGLLGVLFRSVNTTSFDYFESLLWLTVLVVAGAASLGGSVLAAVLLVAVPATFTESWVTEWQPIVFGVAAVLLAQAANGIVGALRPPDAATLAARSRWRLASSPVTRATARVLPTPAES